MGKVVNSGSHKLMELFGTGGFGFIEEVKRLRSQLQEFEHQRDVAQAKEREGYSLITLEIIVGISGLICWAAVSSGWRSIDGSLTTTVALLIVGCVAAIVALTFAYRISSHQTTRNELSEHCARIRRQMVGNGNSYEHSVIQRLQHFAENRGEIGRVAERGYRKWLFFCPSSTAMLDFHADDILIINTIDCRDVQLSFKEIERRSVSIGTVDSAAKRSLAGAAIGSLVFGDAGMIAGSVVGSAGERKTSSETIETKVGKYVVDIYTRLQHLPVVTLEFNSDEALAKEFYAVLSAALPTQN